MLVLVAVYVRKGREEERREARMDRTAEQGVYSVVYFRVGYAVAGNNSRTWFCGSAIGGESESSTRFLSAGRGRRQPAAAPCTESEAGEGSAGWHSRKERLGVYSGMVMNGCEAGFQWKPKILSAIKSWKAFI